MKTSEQINEIAGALAKAQAEITAAEKDRTNPHFNSRYATLDALWGAVRGPLTKHGLALIQGTASQPDGDSVSVTVTTTLLHGSGQWLSSDLTLWPKDASPQAIGSVLTYGRRYGLAGMVGVTAEEDDDANAGQENGRKLPGYYKRPAEKSTLSAAQLNDPNRQFPKTTDKDVDDAFGPRGSTPPAAAAAPKMAAIESRTLTREVRQEQEALLKDIDRLAGELDMSQTDCDTIWATYCGAATRKNVACQALSELRSYLNLRLDKAKAS